MFGGEPYDMTRYTWAEQHWGVKGNPAHRAEIAARVCAGGLLLGRGFIAGVTWGSVVAAVGLSVVSLVTDPPRKDAPERLTGAVAVPGTGNPDQNAPAAISVVSPTIEGAVEKSTGKIVGKVAGEVAGKVTGSGAAFSPAPAAEDAPLPAIAPALTTAAKPDAMSGVTGSKNADKVIVGTAIVGTPNATPPLIGTAPPESPSPEVLAPEALAPMADAGTGLATDGLPTGLSDIVPAAPPGPDQFAAAPAVGDAAEVPAILKDMSQAVPPGIEPAPPMVATAADPAPKPTAISLLPETAGASATPDAAAPLPLPPLTAQEQALLDAANAIERTDIVITDIPVEMPGEFTSDKSAAEAGAGTVAGADTAAGGGATLPQPGFDAPVAGVKTGRLPVVGAPGPVPAKTSSGKADPTPKDEATPVDAMVPDLPPVQRFAREFENPAAKPIFAVLLLDTGGPDLDRASLADLPFPVTFVLDPGQPDVATSAAIYRAAGQEVVMLAAGLPAGAKPSDISVTFEAWGQILPEAVAVLDPQNGGYQSNRTLAGQVLAVIGDQGRGVLSWDRGLNAVSQIARREGMTNATIYRNLDANDESTATIRRYLDRAAFKAAQDGRVLVLGRTRPETIAALLEWAVEGRAATVALGPVTAAMTSQ